MAGPLLLAAPPIVICLCTVFSGAGDDSRGGGTGTDAPWGGSGGSRHRTSGTANVSEGAGVSVSAHSLASSAGRGFDDGRFNTFLAAALLRVVRDAVHVQAPAPASVDPSAAVRGFDTGFSCGLDAGGVGKVGENAAACRVDVPLARLPRALLRVDLLSVRS